MIDSEIVDIKIQPLFYFKYQMRLEFIPFIQQEVEQFISFAAKIIRQKQKINQILIIVNKRIKDIDHFYRENWSDYRAHHILRSKKILSNFCKQNHQKISERIVEKVELRNQKITKFQTPKNIKSQAAFQINDKDLIEIKENHIKSRQKMQLNNNSSQSGLQKNVSQKNFLSFNNIKIKESQQKKNAISKNKLIIQSPKIQNYIRQSPKKGPVLKQSPKTTPKIVKKQVQKKLTKEEYIEYLRNKKQSS